MDGFAPLPDLPSRNQPLLMLTRTLPAGVSALFFFALATIADCRAQGGEIPAPQQGSTQVGLPTFLLPVPGGTTTTGVTFDQLMLAIQETLSPGKPERALAAPDKIVRALKYTASELGQSKEQVETFLLGKWPVKNSEFEIYVKTLREQGIKVHAPFHWWQRGMKADYEKHLEDINKEFKADGKLGPKLYWERHGDDLPYAVTDEQGKSIAELPVTFVSYRDAIQFAGWVGMRLPTEAERTRAARGDGNQMWLWGSNKAVGDNFTDKSLTLLQLANMREREVKPTGTVKSTVGPFGHVDLTGQVWEFVASPKMTFGPINGIAKFDAEWKALMKDKIGSQVKEKPGQKDNVAVIKGGSAFSANDPIQLHIDARDKLDPTDALDVVGLRLAKSLKPGYDLLVSWVSAGYDQTMFGADQAIDYKNQVGVERYVLAENGFPKEYHAFSFAPVSWLTSDKNPSLQKIEEKTQQSPIAIGTIATTEKMLVPALPANQLYTLGYRKEGFTKELSEAIKAGIKELHTAEKKKEHGEKDEGAGDKKSKGPDWRSMIAKYGLNEKDLAAGEPAFVRVNGYEIPTDKAAFIFQDNAGKIIAHLQTSSSLNSGSLVANDLLFDSAKTKEGAKAHVELRGCVPLQAGQKKGVSFKLEFTIDCRPNSPEVPWRLPQAANAAASNTPVGTNNSVIKDDKGN